MTPERTDRTGDTLHKLDKHDLKQLVAFWEEELALPCLACDKKRIADILVRLNAELERTPI